jgi:hypothetical protein
MSKAEYKRLGDYIREVNVRNRDLKVTNRPITTSLNTATLPPSKRLRRKAGVLCQVNTSSFAIVMSR